MLGCLPGLVTLCGWIGPSPAVSLEPAVDGSEPRYVKIPVRAAAMPEHDDGPTASRQRRWKDLRLLRSRERSSEYVADMEDANKWTVPPAPAPDNRATDIVKVCLSKLSPPGGAAGRNEPLGNNAQNTRPALYFG